MQITPLPEHLTAEAVRLWQECGLTRPWNDPDADLARALAGPSSTVLAGLEVRTDADASRPGGTAAVGSLVGTVMVGHDGHRGWVYYLAVSPAHRGEGHGRALMEAAERWLQARGVPKVQLMVRTDNGVVVDFYHRLGYGDQGVAVLGRFLDPELEARRRSGTSAST